MDIVKSFFIETGNALPSSFQGFMSLSKDEWIKVGPVIAFSAFIAGHIIWWLAPKQRTSERINKKQMLQKSKVVNTVDLEDIGDKKVYCRCWKSSSFPLCDGSHNQWNKECHDNVGPLIVCSSKKAA